MDNNKLKCVASFIIGASVGVGITMLCIKKEWEAKMDETLNREIDKIKDYYTKEKQNDISEAFNAGAEAQAEKTLREKIAVNKDKPTDILKTTGMAEKVNYGSYFAGKDEEPADIPEEEQESDNVVPTDPEIISPEDFGEDGYDMITYTYYEEDDIVADELDEIVPDWKDRIGEACLRTFGEFANDAVYVRNDVLKTDYEILRSDENFYQKTKDSPQRVW